MRTATLSIEYSSLYETQPKVNKCDCHINSPINSHINSIDMTTKRWMP